MQKKINKILYDTGNAVLIRAVELDTAYAGNILFSIYRDSDGNWFQTIEPKGARASVSEIITSRKAREWLKKYCFHRQLNEYFGKGTQRLQPDRRVLVAPTANPKSQVGTGEGVNERIYYDPKKGWKIKRSLEARLIPLIPIEAANLVKALMHEKGYQQSALTFIKGYLYECVPLSEQEKLS